jgi:hypothetical protein
VGESVAANFRERNPLAARFHQRLPAGFLRF